MIKNDFSGWLQLELNNRNWSKADLARASGLSSAQITRIVKREQNPGPESCSEIARAFKMPPEMVFRIAGLLPQESQYPDEPPTLREWIRIYLLADPDERDRMLEVARTLSQRSRKE